MLSDFTGADKVYLACGYTDLRLGIDGLAALVKQQFSLDPLENCLFLFCGRRRDRIKALYWEGNGFLLLYKRLESGSFQWPQKESEARALTMQQYRWLMEGLNIDQPKAHKQIEETGNVALSSKVAEKLVKIPVQIRFNKDCTAIQIAAAESESSVTFPKSGRKTIPNAVKILKENRIPFSVIFSGELCEDAAKWRGERRINPTDVLLQTTRGTKKK